MPQTSILRAWEDSAELRLFQTGVSLHSHTSHSRETLDFIPRLARHSAPVRAGLERYEARYRRLHGAPLDYRTIWWTPPLGPREALSVERQQIEGLSLRPLVSITDHDNIEAPLLLRVLNESRELPISVEWSLPYRGTELHIGVHNLPSRRADERMSALQQFTSAPEEHRIGGILEWLADLPEVLVVFNHPHWDEKGIGQDLHDQIANEFLFAYRSWIHAVELNGLRPWRENKRVLDLALRHHVPAVAGGDRHCCEPNALLNVSSARDIREFIEEVRQDGKSTVLIMPQYRESLATRVMRSIADVMRDNNAHTHGWTRWSDRVFTSQSDGTVAPLSSIWAPGSEPSMVRCFVALSKLLEHRGLMSAMRQVLEPLQELS